VKDIDDTQDAELSAAPPGRDAAGEELPDSDPGSLVEDLRRLGEDGRTYFEAELAFQKARAGYTAERGKAVALHGALALALVFFALMALVLGAVLVLAERVGPLAATALVVTVLLLGAALSGLIVRRNLRRIREAFTDSEA